MEDGVNGMLVPDGLPPGEAEVAAFARALVRVSKMTFGDLRSAALEKFSFDLMIARTRRVYEECKEKISIAEAQKCE